jgi:hypothetical protein
MTNERCMVCISKCQRSVILPESVVTCNQWSLISYSISSNIQLCPHDWASIKLNYSYLYINFRCNVTLIYIPYFLVNEHSSAAVTLRDCVREVAISNYLSVVNYPEMRTSYIFLSFPIRLPR